MIDEMTLTLNNPITEEQWDMLEDVDLDHTASVTFHTKHGKTVDFVKLKRGKWIADNNNYITPHFVCTFCGMSQKVETIMFKPIWAFCPRCGAHMREGGEQE